MLKTKFNAFPYSDTQNNKKAKNGSVFGSLAGLVEDTATAATKAVAERQGQTIKSTIKNVLSKKYGELDTKNLFDDIDDRDIENNIGIAESAIKANIDKGFLSKDHFKKLPNLRDVLDVSFAASEKGNSKEAKRAREAAYMEDEPLVKETDSRLLYNSLAKKNPANAENTAKKRKQAA